MFKKIMFNSSSSDKSSFFFFDNIVAQILSIELDSIYSIKRVIKMQSCKTERCLYLIACSALIGTQWASGHHKCQAANHMVQTAARQKWPFHPIPVMLHHVMLLTQGKATWTALLQCYWVKYTALRPKPQSNTNTCKHRARIKKHGTRLSCICRAFMREYVMRGCRLVSQNVWGTYWTVTPPSGTHHHSLLITAFHKTLAQQSGAL